MIKDLTPRKINELFPTEDPDKNLPDNQVDEPFEEDMHLARESIKDSIHEIGKAIGEVADLAYSSQSPRFYEVYGNLLKTKVDASDKLVGLHRTRKDVRGREQAPVTAIQHQQNLVVTSSQLLDLINQNQNDPEIKEIK